MKTCHNEIEVRNVLGALIRGETCGRIMYVHVHAPTEARAGGRPVTLAHPNNGTWHYCLHCDTDDKGCAACEDSIPATG